MAGKELFWLKYKTELLLQCIFLHSFPFDYCGTNLVSVLSKGSTHLCDICSFCFVFISFYIFLMQNGKEGREKEMWCARDDISVL